MCEKGRSASRSASCARVGDRRRRADELRIRSVVPADAPQPAQHVAQVAAEHAAIGVQLVDDDEAQVLEQLRPPRMVRQDAGVQHVGIGEHDVRARRGSSGGRRPACRRRRCARRSSSPPASPTSVGQLVQLGHLVLRQRLGRKEVERARRAVLQDRVEDRQVVAERLARRGRRGDDDVLAGGDALAGLGLMRCRAGVRPRCSSAARRRGSSQSGNGS